MSLAALLTELREFDTALLANTITHIDPTPAHQWYMASNIQSVTPTLGPTVGIAVTCELDSSTPGGKPSADGYWEQLEQMQKMDVPAVWVVKTAGSRREHECVIGDGMAKTLFSVGCIGLVTDGGIRDVSGLLTTTFAAYCRGTTIHHECLRFSNLNQPIEVGGITVKTGDIVHANHEGVITIPKSCAEKLPTRAIKMRAAEHDIHRYLRRTDMSLKERRDMVVKIFAEWGFGADSGPEHEFR